MSKTELTLSIEEEKLEVMTFWLKKENATVQKKMDEELRELYEQTVPEGVSGPQSRPSQRSPQAAGQKHRRTSNIGGDGEKVTGMR